MNPSVICCRFITETLQKFLSCRQLPASGSGDSLLRGKPGQR